MNSIKKITFLFLAVVLAATSISFSQNHSMQMKSKKTDNQATSSNIVHKGIIDLVKIDKNKDGKVFQCPMDLNVISDSQKDECPECGMRLREMSLEDTKAKLIKKGFEVKDDKTGESSKSDSKEEKTVSKIWNKVCPVMGEEVDSEAPTFEYKGKLIGFCCAGCDKKFQKDPEKYMKNLSEDGSKYIGKK